MAKSVAKSARFTLPAIDRQKKWRVAALSYVAFCLLYTFTGHIHRRPPVELLPSGLDRQIPFLAWSVWIYHSQFFFLALAVAFLKKRDTISRTLYAMGLASLLSFVIFFLYPTTISRTAPLGTGLTAQAFELLYTIDSAANCLPSLHVALAWLAATGVFKERRWPGLLFCVWAGLISASTLTTGQHYLIDVAAGVGLALVCHFVLRELK